MRIVSLNTYGGFAFEPLMKFIKDESATTDVFCFQEVGSSPITTHYTGGVGFRRNLLQEIAKILPDFDSVYFGVQEDLEVEPISGETMTTGQATFVRKSLPVIDSGSFFIANGFNTYTNDDSNTLGHALVHTTVKIEDQEITVCNIHGIAAPYDKKDSPLRLEQTKKIVDFINTVKNKKVIIGDFNLEPDTQCIRMIEEAGFKNLITNFKITTTRGAFMRELFPQYEFGKYGFQDFADYAFVSSDIKVNTFSVPETRISDHLPMILDCE